MSSPRQVFLDPDGPQDIVTLAFGERNPPDQGGWREFVPGVPGLYFTRYVPPERRNKVYVPLLAGTAETKPKTGV